MRVEFPLCQNYDKGNGGKNKQTKNCRHIFVNFINIEVKNTQQNTSKMNSEIYKKDYTL